MAVGNNIARWQRSMLLVMTILLSGTVSGADSPNWKSTLESISSAIVSIRVDSTRAFDTEWYSSSQATGFVVDAERGILLTNRHVVSPGPVTAEAVFINHEELKLTPIYRDPVHDFGFFRFDPKALKYIKPAQLSLRPELAAIGREIRVVGNDAGEKLSILAGTLARLDRRAPHYGEGKYNDFNTFYIQAASGTSGGSSGAPVVAIDGSVVALSAGSNSRAATSFFLPLDRIVRALELIRQQLPVTRGSLQTVFEHKTFDELTRLGLSGAAERALRDRDPARSGMLTVKEVISGSPADAQIQPGDILLALNGVATPGFDVLAAQLDSHVGKDLQLVLERGGERRELTLPVSDLHQLTPDAYLEFGNAIVNNLSYQQALSFNVPLAGVYVASPGYVLGNHAVPFRAVISEIGGKQVDSIEQLREQLARLADHSHVTLRYSRYEDRRNSVLTSIKMDRTWFPSRYCRRDDSLGVWPCEQLMAGPTPPPPSTAQTRLLRNGDARVNAVAPSLVHVKFDLPYPVSGLSNYTSFQGTGLIVDRKRGWVLVDRNTVPVAMGDVTITFAGSLQVRGTVEYLHPLHNVALVSYDPSMIGDTPVAEAVFDTRPLTSGDSVWVIGLRSNHQLAQEAGIVAMVDSLVLPLSGTMMYRDSNIDAISLVNGGNNFDGVLVNHQGAVRALWSSFAYERKGKRSQLMRGLSIELARDFVERMQQAKPLYSLEVEANYVPLFSAAELGLSQDWQLRLEQHDPRRRRVLKVRRVVVGTQSQRWLKSGDLILAVDGQLVTSFRELERAVQRPRVRLSLWRGGAQLELDIETTALPARGIDRAVSWAGALLQAPHRSLAAQRGIERSGVFVAHYSPGSPAARYGLQIGRRIVEVDGQPTPDLATFIDQVGGREHRSSVRLKTINWNRSVEVITLKLDQHYWPSYELQRRDQHWRRTAIN